MRLPTDTGALTILSQVTGYYAEYYAYSGLAVDATHVYFSYFVSNTAKAFLTKISIADGGTTNLVAGDNGLQANNLVVDDAKAYWTANNGLVRSVSLGGGIPTEIGTTQAATTGIAVNGANLYWTTHQSPGAIMTASISGGVPTAFVSGQNTPTGIALDSTSVYWTNYGSGTVMKASLAGGAPTVLASSQGYPWAIAVDDTSVYFTTVGDGTIMKVTPK